MPLLVYHVNSLPIKRKLRNFNPAVILKKVLQKVSDLVNVCEDCRK